MLIGHKIYKNEIKFEYLYKIGQGWRKAKQVTGPREASQKIFELT
jgi:hypothetical protein